MNKVINIFDSCLNCSHYNHFVLQLFFVATAFFIQFIFLFVINGFHFKQVFFKNQENKQTVGQRETRITKNKIISSPLLFCFLSQKCIY